VQKPKNRTLLLKAIENMKVEFTPQQSDTIVEALGLALAAIPPNQRVAVSAMSYAPIVQILQQAAQTPVEPTKTDEP
jgi:hypothetical protein